MRRSFRRRASAGALGAGAAILLLEASRTAAGVPFSAARLLERALFVFAVVGTSRSCRPFRERGRRWTFPPAAAMTAAIGTASLAAAAGAQSVAGAWIALAALFALTLGAALPAGDPASRAGEALRTALLAAAAGVAPMIALEIECRFAHEELFVAFEALLLGAAWLSLLLASAADGRPGASPGRGLALPPRPLAAASLLLAAAVLAASIAAYQKSFFPEDPPSYAGVSKASPFLCATAAPSPETFDAGDVFRRLTERVAANPRKGAPEDAMLALATGDAGWAGRFREELLNEVRQGRFSRHRQTKYWQYEAALRTYYFPRTDAAFAGLFSADERRRVAAWFAEINRRALSVGIDDVIYGTAYRKVPEGPYENQENGAALLSILEAEHLAAPDLSPANRRYLDRVPRGWQARFRNTDDSFSYQSEWITNAYLQSLRTGTPPREAVRRSFEWLLLQTSPDGFAPDYNPSGEPALPATAYLGASLLRDPTLLWIAAKSLRSFEKRGVPLRAQPGIERAVDLPARSPAAGSCLLYGESGLPTLRGPLAPDKIVFRGGWEDADPYLLLNLRFAGWHRYKATNTITLLRDRGETVVSEERGEPYRFVPLERRLFRDKRIPREYLNGLLVEPTGLAGALSRLAGFGGPWAQDPPRTARIERFDPFASPARSTTLLAGWRGWTHRRTIAFEAGSPIVVVDDARGPSRRAAGLSWHVEGIREPSGGRYRLGPAGSDELVLLPLDEEGGRVVERAHRGEPRLELVYRPRRTGRLRLASVFLAGKWRGAGVSLRKVGDGGFLAVRREGEIFSLPLP